MLFIIGQTESGEWRKAADVEFRDGHTATLLQIYGKPGRLVGAESACQ